MNTKVAVGLIVLTSVGTYAVSNTRRHHFEPTKLGDGSILLDTETGVECSARFDLKWTDDNKKAVWAAGLAAKKAETAYASYVSSRHMGVFDQVAAINQMAATDRMRTQPVPTSLPETGAVSLADITEAVPAEFESLYTSMEEQDSTYNALVEKADSEKIPDSNSSYFKNFPLCKNIR